MNEYEHFKRNSFETYSFPRLVRTPCVEFFFIRGINGAQDFNEYWDGRLIEVLGYLVLYSDIQNDEQKNYIYLIEDEGKNYQEITRFTKMFASEMSTVHEVFDMKNFTVRMTNVYQKGLLQQHVVDFMRRIVNEDIPEIVWEEVL